MHENVTKCTKVTRDRYDYEHKILLDWRNQLTASPAENLSFLNQYYFDVSDDPLLDNIDWVSPPECRVDVGDMKLPLSAIRHLAEALMTSLEAVLAETGVASGNAGQEGGAVSVDSTSAAPGGKVEAVADESRATNPEGVLDAFVTALVAAGRSLVGNFSGIPRAWKSSQRIESLARSLVKIPISVGGAANAFASMTVDLVLSLVYATIQCTPSLDYCTRLYDAVATEEGASFDLQSALTKARVHPRLCGGWWASPRADEDVSEEVKGATTDALAAIMLACSYNGGVQKRLFLKALCMSPREVSSDAF